MLKIRNTLLTLLSLSIIFMGIPGFAKAPCPMGSGMQMTMQKDGKMCDGCKQTSQQNQTNKGCCGDMSCTTKCSSARNTGTALLGTQSTLFSLIMSAAERFYVSGDVLVSYPLNTQDRPPKYLS